MDMKEHDEGVVQSVNDQAAEWFIRLRDRDLTASDRRKFVRWLKQSPSHIAEFMRLCQLYGRVKRAKVPTLEPEEVESNVIPLLQREPAPAERPAPRLFGSRKLQFAAAACCLALIGVIGRVALSTNTIETHVSEWRQVPLADGSTMSAGPNTLLQVDYSKGVRRVRLEHGEAMFQVAKDASRPFIVDAGGAAVRAIGTKFAVDRSDQSIVVTVAEGKVAVARGDRAAALETTVDAIDKSSIVAALGADERVQISTNAPAVMPQVEKINASNALAWAKGRLIFMDETLANAVREFNRRNRIQIVVDDPELAALTVCCVYDASDPEAFAEAAAVRLDIALVRDGPDRLRLVPEASAPVPPAGHADSI
jgi:transmembrane sensor